MTSLPNAALLAQSLSKTKKAIVLIGSTPNFDLMASALGFFLALKAKGIAAQVVCPVEMRVEFSHLVGVDSVQKKIGNRNLIVSFAYSEDQVEKVSYNISEDGKRFNLVISPKTGVMPLDPQTVDYEYAGADADFIALFGINSFEELGEGYQKERLLFDTAMTVSFSPFAQTPFTKCHLEMGKSSSLCEFMVSACEALGIPLDQDSAANFLVGIDVSTDGFRAPTVSADTFETVAKLMRLGAFLPQTVKAPQMTQAQMPFVPAQTTEVSTNQFAGALGNAGH